VFADLQTGNGPNADPLYIDKRIDTALTDADGRIVKEFAISAAAVPATSSPYYGRLATIANYFALSALYRPRSLNDKNSAGYLALWEDIAMTELQGLVWAVNRDQLCAAPSPALLVTDPKIYATMRAAVGF
jgi:hypothetical protein